MKTQKFIILDKTANTGKDYIGENGNNVEFEWDALQFDTKEEAESFAETLNTEAPKWWSVMEYTPEVPYMEISDLEDLETAIEKEFEHVIQIDEKVTYAYSGNVYDLVWNLEGLEYDSNSSRFMGCPISEAKDFLFS